MKTCITVTLAFAALQIVVAASPVTLELKSGSKITGELVSWDGDKATVKADFGDVVLTKSQLTGQALSELTASSGDASALKAKISELQATVESLRRDNSALRAQLAGQSPAAPANGAQQAVASPQAADKAPAADGYWISSSGKRHSPNCRYFRNCSGRPGTATEGTPCKICGG